MSQNLHVIVGLGETGLSCVRYLSQKGIPLAIIDSRKNPPHFMDFIETYPNIPVSLGKMDSPLLDQADKIILSPGVSLHEPAIIKQLNRGVPVVGDVELFATAANAPIIAITGTNAKSTVTTLVGQMAVESDLNVEVGGNLGIPSLDLLRVTPPDLYVLELSSFQLETTNSLRSQVATVLNVTPDHMDRYNTFNDYYLAKQRIYQNCQNAVCNRDDSYTDCDDRYEQNKFYFTLGKPQQNEFGLIEKNGQQYLGFEAQELMPITDLPILGRHYQANALAALAIGYAYGFPMDKMINTLRVFKGLPHRCQLVRKRDGVTWYNDSKGTNVGATLAAINGLGSEINGKLILIAGGVGKNADFSSLVPAVKQYVRKVILIGEAAAQLDILFKDFSDTSFANTMDEAVIIASKDALFGDSVLLSPACASFDMFNNFEHRGEVFTKLVQDLS